MICDILSTVEKYNMLKDARTVAVGISGGADSVCLLHFLSRIREKYGIVLSAVHVNHNIRGEEAARDEAFVKDFCKMLNVDCTVFSVDVPSLAKERSISEEECGRQVRYDCFNKIGADVIAVAHTLSDSVETVIFNLTRGTGLKGICGIPPVRDNIIRPLIEITRQDVENYCHENGLKYVIDSTNLSDDYTRNKIRHSVIPTLKSINPGFEKSVLRFENNIYDDNSYIEQKAEQLLNDSKCKNGFALAAFQKAHASVQKRAISNIISSALSKPVEARHIDLCFNAVSNGNGKIELSKGLYILVTNDIISIHKAAQKAESWSCMLVNGAFFTPFGSYTLEKCNVSVLSTEDYENAIDAKTVFGDMILTSRTSGDKYTDYKRKNTKTLKKLFNEKKIPIEDRDKIAILKDRNDVLWVEGIGVNAKHRINKKSEYAYIIKKGEF